MKNNGEKKTTNFKRLSIIYVVVAFIWLVAAILQFTANNKVLGCVNIFPGILFACAAFISISKVNDEKNNTNDNI